MAPYRAEASAPHSWKAWRHWASTGQEHEGGDRGSRHEPQGRGDNQKDGSAFELALRALRGWVTAHTGARWKGRAEMLGLHPDGLSNSGNPGVTTSAIGAQRRLELARRPPGNVGADRARRQPILSYFGRIFSSVGVALLAGGPLRSRVGVFSSQRAVRDLDGRTREAAIDYRTILRVSGGPRLCPLLWRP